MHIYSLSLPPSQVYNAYLQVYKYIRTLTLVFGTVERVNALNL